MNSSYILNGNEFDSLEEFYDCIGDQLLPNEFWGKNLDALNDILSGGFNIPDAPFELVWLNADKSSYDLGVEATIRWYKQKMEAQPENSEYLVSSISNLECGNNDTQTLFQVLVEILAENAKSHEWRNASISFKF